MSNANNGRLLSFVIFLLHGRPPPPVSFFFFFLVRPLAAAAENSFGVTVPRSWSDGAAAATVRARGGQPTVPGAGGGRCASPQWRRGLRTRSVCFEPGVLACVRACVCARYYIYIYIYTNEA